MHWHTLLDTNVLNIIRIGRLSCHHVISRADCWSNLCFFVHASSVSSLCFLADSFSKAAQCTSMPCVLGKIWGSFSSHLHFPMFIREQLLMCTAFLQCSFSRTAPQTIVTGFLGITICSIRNMSEQIQKHTKKSTHLPWSFDDICLVRTSMCLLHMVWGFISFIFHILQASVSQQSIVFHSGRLQHSGWVTRLSYSILSGS